MAWQAVAASQQLRLLSLSSSRASTRQKTLFLNLSPHNSPCHRPASTRVSRSQEPKRAFNLTKLFSHRKEDKRLQYGRNLSNKCGKGNHNGWTTSRKTTTTHSSRTTTKVASATKLVCRVAIIKVRNFLFNFVSGYNQQRPPPMGTGMPVQQQRGTYAQSQSQTQSGYAPKVNQSAPFAATNTPLFPAAASHIATTAAPSFVEKPIAFNLTTF